MEIKKIVLLLFLLFLSYIPVYSSPVHALHKEKKRVMGSLLSVEIAVLVLLILYYKKQGSTTPKDLIQPDLAPVDEPQEETADTSAQEKNITRYRIKYSKEAKEARRLLKEHNPSVHCRRYMKKRNILWFDEVRDDYGRKRLEYDNDSKIPASARYPAIFILDFDLFAPTKDSQKKETPTNGQKIAQFFTSYGYEVIINSRETSSQEGIKKLATLYRERLYKRKEMYDLYIFILAGNPKYAIDKDFKDPIQSYLALLFETMFEADTKTFFEYNDKKYPREKKLPQANFRILNLACAFTSLICNTYKIYLREVYNRKLNTLYEAVDCYVDFNKLLGFEPYEDIEIADQEALEITEQLSSDTVDILTYQWTKKAITPALSTKEGMGWVFCQTSSDYIDYYFVPITLYTPLIEGYVHEAVGSRDTVYDDIMGLVMRYVLGGKPPVHTS